MKAYVDSLLGQKLPIPVRDESSRLIRVGLIGAGPWGRNYIKTLKTLSGAELTRLSSRNPQSPKLVEPTCEIMDDWRALIRSGDLDGVIVATPPALHAEMVEYAVTVGLPVMVEKPLTMKLKEALHLQDVIEESGTPVLVDHTYLFHPGYVALKEKTKDLGPIRFIHSVGGNRGPFRPNVPVLWDYGPHDIALCLDLLGGMPTSMEAEHLVACETDEGYGEILHLGLNFPGGVSAAISLGNLMPTKRRYLAVYFKEYALVLDDLADHKLTIHRIEDRPVADPANPTLGPGTAIPVPTTLPLTCAVRTFVSGISGGSREMFGVVLGVNIVRVLSECQSILGPGSR